MLILYFFASVQYIISSAIAEIEDTKPNFLISHNF